MNVQSPYSACLNSIDKVFLREFIIHVDNPTEKGSVIASSTSQSEMATPPCLLTSLTDSLIPGAVLYIMDDHLVKHKWVVQKSVF